MSRCNDKHPLRGLRCILKDGHSGEHVVRARGYSYFRVGEKTIKVRADGIERWHGV